MSTTELLPYEGQADPYETKRYQRKVGSLLYAATTTRPDIAFATSRLARFMSNPSPEHHRAADRALCYLAKTRSLALQFGNGNRLEIASDSSFADNTRDRKSSQGCHSAIRRNHRLASIEAGHRIDVHYGGRVVSFVANCEFLLRGVTVGACDN